MNLNLYEDAIKKCDEALEIDIVHGKSLYRKAKCFVYTFDFDQAK